MVKLKAELSDPRYALAFLQDIQKEHGYIPRPRFFRLAADMGIPPSELYAVATFYKALSLEPRGRHIIKVCDGTACHVRGSMKLLDAIKRELGIGPGGTTDDLCFSLEVVNCIGACAIAPAMLIDGKYYGRLTPKSLSRILAEYRESGGERDAV